MKLSRFLFALLLCPMVASAATTAPVVGDAERAFHESLATHGLGNFDPSTTANVVNFVTRRLPVAREVARAP